MDDEEMNEREMHSVAMTVVVIALAFIAMFIGGYAMACLIAERLS